jgi:hypothetical protein
MRCGCISMGDVRCDACHRTIRYLERYLAIGSEAEDTTERLCIECALSKGYAQYREEKGEKTTTFFVGVDGSI